MSILSDILQALDRWDEWKALRAAPGKLAALEARIAALEARAGAKPAGRVCEKCTGPLMFLREEGHAIFGDMGVKVQTWRCEPCALEFEFERKR